MWLQRLDDKDNVEHRALFYLQVGSCRSFQFIVRPFFLVFPALLNIFFPVPFSFPMIACPCVPVQAINSAYFPKNYVPHIVTAAASLVLIRAFSQGRTTSRDRDLHARTVLVTVRYVFFE